MPENSTVKYTTEDKLRWEVEKLQAEVVNLKRAWIHNPASWFTIITAIVALVGVAIQYVKSDNAFTLSEIKRQQSELKTSETENLRQQLLSQVTQTKNDLSQLQTERDKVSNELNSLLKNAKELQDKANSAAEMAGIREAAQKVTNSLDELRILNQQVSDRAQETQGNLQAISTALTSGDSSLQAFAVIASFKQRDAALARAQELKSKGLQYPLEVYQREPNRFALTLGGNLSYQEASRRVDYAKQNGIASDAYVRLARNWGENLFR
jgi:DNA repair exonuclease SbcCD ATPase subunit